MIRAAIRTIRHGGLYSLLNIVGLAVGLASFSMISTWVMQELEFDTSYPLHDRVVRVVMNVRTETEDFGQAVTSMPLAAAFKEDVPEVENTTRIDQTDCIVRYEDRQFQEDDVLFVDNAFLTMFGVTMISGDPSGALTKPYTIVLTASIARTYFGDEDPVGKTMTLFRFDPDGKGAPYLVTGVVPDPPDNMHLRYSILGSFVTVEKANPDRLTSDWRFFNNSYYTYLQLRRPEDIAAVEAGIPAFIDRHFGERTRQLRMTYGISLQPVSSIHLDSRMRYEMRTPGNRQTIFMFGTIGIAILIVACINYMNIAVARAMRRAKEVGMRKILGASRMDLIRHVLAESIVSAVLSLIVSIALIEAARPIAEYLSGSSLDGITAARSVGILSCAALLCGLLAGLYPALFLSALSPAMVVRSWKSSLAGVLTRKGLVILQFSVAMVLLAGVAVVSSQLEYIRTKDLGYVKDALLILDQNGYRQVNDGFEAFRDDLLRTAAVSGVTTSRGLIGASVSNWYVETVNGAGDRVSASLNQLTVGPEYFDVYGMQLIAGRDFLPSDTNRAFIVNEAAVRHFGWASPADAIGKTLQPGSDVAWTIVGVVHDFHFATLHQQIAPLMLSLSGPNVFSRIAVRIRSADMREGRTEIERLWAEHFPGTLLKSSFMDERLERLYESEKVFERVFGAFVILAVVVACLGLFGLASYAIARRTKEVGVRRVLGASRVQLVLTLSHEFLILVGLSFVVATPVAWQIMTRWLDAFSYRIELGPTPFLLSGAVVLLVAFGTVGLEALRTARRNPVESLRYE